MPIDTETLRYAEEIDEPLTIALRDGVELAGLDIDGGGMSFEEDSIGYEVHGHYPDGAFST